MYRIGEFSSITKLSVKTLRYYDKEGILTPENRDEDTGYRLYSEENYERAELIKLLRELDFSISEIKDLLMNYEDKSDLPYFIREKKNILERKIKTYRGIQEKMDKYIKNIEEGVKSMNYEMKTKKVEDKLIASTRFKGKYQDTGVYLGKLFKAVKMSACGKPFSLYYDEEFKDDHADIEVCVPVKKEVNDKEVYSRVLQGRKVLYTIHVGPYEALGGAYKALFDYAKKNNIEYKIPFREIYHKGPGMILKGNPNKYQTEVQLVIKD